MDSDSLISVLRKHSGKEQIFKSHSIVDDLGIDGDDADELYFDLLDNYGVYLKKHNDIEECFHSERELTDMLFLFKWALYQLKLRSKPPIRPLRPLFVADLLKIVREPDKA